MTTTPKKRATKPVTEEEAIAAIPMLPANAFQHEILQTVVKMRTNASKIEALRRYRNDALVALFIWNYDDTVISALPEGPVPYSKIDELTAGNDTLSDTIQKQLADKKTDLFTSNARTSLRQEVGNFFHFLRGGNDSLSSIKRETIFINLLEGLHPSEAEILILVKDKKLTDRYNLPFSLIQEAYPDIQWGGRS
jgi:hypothetical protein